MRLLALVLLLLPFAAIAQTDLSHGSVAVLELRSKLPAAEAGQIDAAYFADQIRSAAKRAMPSLRVMTRENLLILLESSGKKLEDCEGECEVETGRRIGADLVISGELLRVGSSLKLNLRLHETKGGQLLRGAVASGADVNELDANTRAAVSELLDPPGLRAGPSGPSRETPIARKVGFAAIGLGAAAVALGGIFTLHGQSEISRIQQGGLASGQSIQDADNTAQADKVRTIGCLIGGGLAIAAGVVLLRFNPAPDAPAVALGPSGLVVAGRF